MKEKVAVATVQGKAYYLVANALRERDIGFVSLIPGEGIPSRVIAVITTEHEKTLVAYDKIMVFHGEEELDLLMVEVKKLLLGKGNCEQIVVGIDPGESIGVASANGWNSP